MGGNRPVLVTGAGGFIARHVVTSLLEAGYAVRGTLRRESDEEGLRADLAAHLADPGRLDLFEVTCVDLGDDRGWVQACVGAGALMHTASPFPMAQPRAPAAVIRPAVEGTRRALAAARAAGISRVILTSSAVAILGAPARGRPLTEADWSDGSDRRQSPYARSKTLAERAAWEIAGGQPEMALTALNPGLVLGRPIGRRSGTSLGVVARILAGRDPMLPRVAFPVVDVRDVAAAQLAALERPNSAGARVILAAGTMSFAEMARHLAARFPDRRIATREAPDLLVRALALFDRSIRAVLPDLGRRPELSNARARELLGLSFTSPEDSLDAAADFPIRTGT